MGSHTGRPLPAAAGGPRADAGQQTVTLFVPCFVEHLSPVSVANLRRLLVRLGVPYTIPPGQTCCGQPSFNAGFWHEAARCAEHFIEVFRGADVVLAPSASCVAMVRHYPQLRELSPAFLGEAESLANRTHEICSYLVDVLGLRDVGARWDGAVAYHDACHAKRGLGVQAQPRTLLENVRGLELRELEGAQECCGFGGTFSVKYPEISADMADAKLDALATSGTRVLVSTDLSCLIHLETRARRRGLAFEGLHVVDILGAGGGPEVRG